MSRFSASRKYNLYDRRKVGETEVSEAQLVQLAEGMVNAVEHLPPGFTTDIELVALLARAVGTARAILTGRREP